MGIVFVDGFDHYPTADFTKKWTSISSTPLIGSGTGRFGSNVLRLQSQTTGMYLNKTLAGSSTWVFGFAFKYGAIAGNNNTMVALYDSGTRQCELHLNTDGTLQVMRNGSSVTGGQSSLALSAATWYYIEWKVTIADSISASTCQVQVNGVNWIDVTAGQDLKNGSTTSANSFAFGKFENNSTGGQDWLYDDLYVRDDTTFLGDCKIETLYPSGAGSNADWTASSGANYTDVDEASTNGDTDYVSSSTTNNVDTYAMGDLSSTPLTIHAVVINVDQRKTDGGSRTTGAVIKSGGTTSVGSSYGVLDSYSMNQRITTVDPNTSSAWTGSAVNAMEAGVKLLS